MDSYLFAETGPVRFGPVAYTFFVSWSPGESESSQRIVIDM